MKLNKILIKMLAEKTGRDVTTVTGADYLRNDIESSTGENLSLNTVKRLTGVLPYDSSPRESTLEIIARYLGYTTWQLLVNDLNNKVSDFNVGHGFIELERFPFGKEISIEWQPRRRIMIRHLGNGKYSVVKAENSKLLSGDILSLSQIRVGFPFIVKEVTRNGVSLGNYTAALSEGISSIEIING